MKRRYVIGLCAAFLAVSGLMAGAFQLSYNMAKREFNLQAEEAAKARTAKKDAEYAASGKTDQTVETDGDAQKEDTYYLAERNGYVVVYLSDKKTVYEYTSIELSQLPETVKKEIQNGKVISGTQSLYGFLENYSS